jgi:hypothetical protein
MRFLLRLAFWLGVVVLLLPGRGPAPASQIGAADAVSAAEATLGDMRQFCERQPEACTVGSQAAQALGDRAKTGAKRLLEFLNEKVAPHDSDPITAATPPRGKAVPLPTPRPSQDTLTAADLAPAWRGPPRRDAQR